MAQTTTSSQLQEVIESVEALPPDDQEILIEVIRQRLAQRKRAQIVAEMSEARTAYERGDVKRGSVADLFAEVEV